MKLLSPENFSLRSNNVLRTCRQTPPPQKPPFQWLYARLTAASPNWRPKRSPKHYRLLLTKTVGPKLWIHMSGKNEFPNSDAKVQNPSLHSHFSTLTQPCCGWFHLPKTFVVAPDPELETNSWKFVEPNFFALKSAEEEKWVKFPHEKQTPDLKLGEDVDMVQVTDTPKGCIFMFGGNLCNPSPPECSLITKS